MTEQTVERHQIIVDAESCTGEEIAGVLKTALDIVGNRSREAIAEAGERGERHPWALARKDWPEQFQLVIDNCERLWIGEGAQENGTLARAIAQLGRVVNVQLLLRSAHPVWVRSPRATRAELGLATIGDAVLRDMIQENLDSETGDVYPAIAFEVMP